MFVSNFLCHVPNHLVFTAMYDLGARFRLFGTMDAVRFGSTSKGLGVQPGFDFLYA